jgi:hypothetical protein
MASNATHPAGAPAHPAGVPAQVVAIQAVKDRLQATRDRAAAGARALILVWISHSSALHAGFTVGAFKAAVCARVPRGKDALRDPAAERLDPTSDVLVYCLDDRCSPPDFQRFAVPLAMFDAPDAEPDPCAVKVLPPPEPAPEFAETAPEFAETAL